MASYVDKIKPENYQRAFFFKNLGYLVTYLCMAHYGRRDFLAIYDNEMTGTYVSNSAVQKTTLIGKEIFSNQDNFAIFEKGFRDVIQKTITYITKVKKFKVVSIGDFYDLWAMVVKMYYYFEKTEFFFTDGYYQGEMNDILKRNLFVLGDDLKMKSRPLFIELISTVLYHLVELAAKKHNMSAEDIKFYDFEEVVHLLESGEAVNQSVISDRKKSFVLYCEDGHIIPIEGEEKILVLERFKEKDYSAVTESKGIIANKGKITARALVVLPELNIPTDIIKTGDLIELDADNGVVRILRN